MASLSDAELLDFGGRAPAVYLRDWDDCQVTGAVRLDGRFRVVTAKTVREAHEAKRLQDRVDSLPRWRRRLVGLLVG